MCMFFSNKTHIFVVTKTYENVLSIQMFVFMSITGMGCLKKKFFLISSIKV